MTKNETSGFHPSVLFVSHTPTTHSAILCWSCDSAFQRYFLGFPPPTPYFKKKTVRHSLMEKKKSLLRFTNNFHFLTVMLFSNVKPVTWKFLVSSRFLRAEPSSFIMWRSQKKPCSDGKCVRMSASSKELGESAVAILLVMLTFTELQEPLLCRTAACFQHDEATQRTGSTWERRRPLLSLSLSRDYC